MITARCHPALRPILPAPQPAGQMRPDWLRTMPGEVQAPSLGGEAVRTLKHCPPFLDAMGLGVMIPLATDLVFDQGQVAWDWDPPVLPDTRIARAPVALHAPEQAQGAPLVADSVLKFMNFWTLEAPPGWSLLFLHPMNRPDLPFHTLSGLVDCDLFRDGYVHFPALWRDAGFTGVLPAGTPVAQVIAVPRNGGGLEIAEMTPDQIQANTDVQAALGATRGVYRKRFRH